MDYLSLTLLLTAGHAFSWFQTLWSLALGLPFTALWRLYSQRGSFSAVDKWSPPPECFFFFFFRLPLWLASAVIGSRLCSQKKATTAITTTRKSLNPPFGPDGLKKIFKKGQKRQEVWCVWRKCVGKINKEELGKWVDCCKRVVSESCGWVSVGPAATRRQPLPPPATAMPGSWHNLTNTLKRRSAERKSGEGVALPFVDDDDDDDDDDDNDHTYSYKALFSAPRQTPCTFVVCDSKGWCYLLIVMAMMMKPDVHLKITSTFCDAGYA